MLEYTSLVIPPLPSFECSNNRINITKVNNDSNDNDERLIGGFLRANDVGYRKLSVSSTSSLSLLLSNSKPLDIQDDNDNDNDSDKDSDTNINNSFLNYIMDDTNISKHGTSLSISSTLASLSIDDFDDPNNESFLYTNLAHSTFDIKYKKLQPAQFLKHHYISNNIPINNIIIDNNDNNDNDNDNNDNIRTKTFLQVIESIKINDNMSIQHNHGCHKITTPLKLDDFDIQETEQSYSFIEEAKRMIEFKCKPLKIVIALKDKPQSLFYKNDVEENDTIEPSFFQPSWKSFTGDSLEDKHVLQKMIKFDDLCDLSYATEQANNVDSFSCLDFADSVLKMRKMKVMKSSNVSTLATLTSATSLLLSSSSWDCKYIPPNKALDKKRSEIKLPSYLEMAKMSINGITTLRLRNLRKVNNDALQLKSMTSSWLNEPISTEDTYNTKGSLDKFLSHAMNTFDRVIDNMNKEHLVVADANVDNNAGKMVTPTVERHPDARTESILIVSSNDSSHDNRRPQKLQRTEQSGKYVITEILAPLKPIEVPHTPVASRVSSDAEPIVDLTNDNNDNDDQINRKRDLPRENVSSSKKNRNGNHDTNNKSQPALNAKKAITASNMLPPASQTPRGVSVSRLVEPETSTIKDNTEYFGIQENEGLESMVSSYLQLHTQKSELNPASISTFSNKNKLQTISKVIETNTKVHQEAQMEKRKMTPQRNQEVPYNAKKAQEIAPIENIVMNNNVLQGLQLIISEDVVENSPQLVADLSRHFGIFCIDARLEEPISIIVDLNAAVSLIPFELLLDRVRLKSYVKTLTKQAFKFETIWILVIMPTNNMPANSINTALLTLCSAISKFPLRMVLRQVKLTHLSRMIFNICQSSSNDAILASNCCLLEKYIRRPFLSDLNTPSFSSLCSFLTKFPTINFMTAAFLLHSHKLSELVLLNASNLKSQSSIPVINEHAIATFLGLINTHIGLEKRNVPAPPHLNDNMLTNYTDQSEKFNQEYETPSNQQNYYDKFVNHNDDRDLVEVYPYRVKKPRHGKDANFFDYDRDSNNEYSGRNERQMDTEMESDPRWNSTISERGQQQAAFYSSNQLNTPTANHNNRSPLIRPAHHHLGVPDKNTNLVYESTGEFVDKGGRKQTTLAFKKKNVN